MRYIPNWSYIDAMGCRREFLDSFNPESIVIESKHIVKTDRFGRCAFMHNSKSYSRKWNGEGTLAEGLWSMKFFILKDYQNHFDALGLPESE